jgi:hypothetical protein
LSIGFVEPDPQATTRCVVETEVNERLAYIQKSFTCAHYGQLAAFAVDDDAVYSIGTRKRGGRGQPAVDEQLLVGQWRLILP